MTHREGEFHAEDIMVKYLCAAEHAVVRDFVAGLGSSTLDCGRAIEKVSMDSEEEKMITHASCPLQDMREGTIDRQRREGHTVRWSDSKLFSTWT